jgi:uncharacterized protein with GYD domain
MHYVLLAEHDADVCPTANATTRELLLQTGQEIPEIAERKGVKLVSGPWVNREHVVVVVVEADRSEAVDRFIVKSRLMQWNRIRILPSLAMAEGMKDVQESTPIF